VTNSSQINTTKALITKRNNPKVISVAGSVKNTNTGFTNIFNKAKTIATIIADDILSTETPGKKLARKYTNIPVNNTLIIVFILIFFLQKKTSKRGLLYS
jgi:hypothetical protein